MKRIDVDGTETPLVGEGRRGEVTLKQLQREVGGYIETRGDLLAVFDEEGLLKKLPPNPRASEIVGYPLVGPVVIFDSEDEKRAWGQGRPWPRP